MRLREIYQRLNKHYPALEPHAETWELWIKPNKSCSEIFEVAIGTVLVQNTNWRNVDRAIINLKREGIDSFEQLQKIALEELKELVKPAGFYNQKAVYLQGLSTLLIRHQAQGTLPARQELLSCKGIGNETADSILLYCFQQALPVVGTYTRRFLTRFRGDVTYLRRAYETIQKELSQEFSQNFEGLSRFHALIVCHAQGYCRKRVPNCAGCVLRENCRYGQAPSTDLNLTQIQALINPPRKKRRNESLTD
jgi:endonuclease-3 related protein